MGADVALYLPNPAASSKRVAGRWSIGGVVAREPSMATSDRFHLWESSEEPVDGVPRSHLVQLRGSFDDHRSHGRRERQGMHSAYFASLPWPINSHRSER